MTADSVRSAGKRAWRRYIDDGIPSSGPYDPQKEGAIDVFVDEVADTLADIDQLAQSGARSPVTVRLIISTNVNLTSGLTAGTVIQGVTLASGDIVLPVGQTNGATVTDPDGSTNSPDNGPRVVGAGAASRDPRYDSGNELVGAQFAAAAGTNTGWIYAVRGNPVIGTDTISITRAYPTGTIGDKTVTNPKLADVPTATIKGRKSAGVGSTEDLTVPETLDLLGLTGVASDNAGLKAAVFPTSIPTVRGWDYIYRDKTGGRALWGYKSTGEKVEFIPTPEQAATDSLDQNVRGWAYIYRDKTGSRALWGFRSSGEYVNFEQKLPDASTSGSGGAVEETPDWLIPQNYPFSIALSTLIPNTISSWWVTKMWRCGGSLLIGLVMRRTKRRRDGTTYWRSGDIAVVELRDDNPDALVYRIGQQFLLTDDHNAAAPTVRPGLRAELGLVVFQSDHASSSEGTYTWMSRNKSPAGLGIPWKTEPGKSGTTYNQAWVRHDRPWERWNLYRGGPSNRWYLMVWDDRLRRVTFRKALFNDNEDQSYFHFWPKPDGSGIRMSWYSNPSSASIEYRHLTMLDLNYDGWIRNLYGNPVGANFFNFDFTEVDALTYNTGTPTQGPTLVYKPDSPEKVFRQCALVNTRPNDWQVPIVEWLEDGTGSKEDECRVRLVNVNTSGSAPVTTAKDVCWGGVTVHNANRGYVGGATVIAHDLIVACRWMPSAATGQKGQLDIYNVSGSEGFNTWPSLYNVRAEEKVIRPHTSLEIMGDELAVSYRLGPDLMWHQGKPYDPGDEDTQSGGYRTFAAWAMNTLIMNVETYQS